jgi:hypothetical protein
MSEWRAGSRRFALRRSRSDELFRNGSRLFSGREWRFFGRRFEHLGNVNELGQLDHFVFVGVICSGTRGFDRFHFASFGFDRRGGQGIGLVYAFAHLFCSFVYEAAGLRNSAF